jgi:membrane protein YdbS with pleckstrin-like domain
MIDTKLELPGQFRDELPGQFQDIPLPAEPLARPLKNESQGLSAAPLARLDAARSALAAGDKATAMGHIRALFAGSPHLEALFYCGAISEQLGKLDDARSWYEHVLQVNGSHRGATRRLAAISQTPTPQPQPPQHEQPSSNPSQVPAAEVVAEGRGFYVTLKGDPSPISKNAVALIDHLRMSRRPLVSDSPFALISLVVMLLVIPTVLLFVPARLRHEEGLLILLASPVMLVFLAAAWIWFQKAMRYELRDGVLKVTQGILSKRTDTYELFRVTNVGVHRGPLQRLFNSGTLTLTVERPAKKLDLVGLARGRKLLSLQDDLRNLSQLLRQNPLIKGIIN